MPDKMKLSEPVLGHLFSCHSSQKKPLSRRPLLEVQVLEVQVPRGQASWVARTHRQSHAQALVAAQESLGRSESPSSDPWSPLSLSLIIRSRASSSSCCLATARRTAWLGTLRWYVALLDSTLLGALVLGRGSVPTLAGCHSYSLGIASTPTKTASMTNAADSVTNASQLSLVTHLNCLMSSLFMFGFSACTRRPSADSLSDRSAVTRDPANRKPDTTRLAKLSVFTRAATPNTSVKPAVPSFNTQASKSWDA